MIEFKCDKCATVHRLIDPPELASLRAKLDSAERGLADAREQTANLLRLVEMAKEDGFKHSSQTPDVPDTSLNWPMLYCKCFATARAIMSEDAYRLFVSQMDDARALAEKDNNQSRFTCTETFGRTNAMTEADEKRLKKEILQIKMQILDSEDPMEIGRLAQSIAEKRAVLVGEAEPEAEIAPISAPATRQRPTADLRTLMGQADQLRARLLKIEDDKDPARAKIMAEISDVQHQISALRIANQPRLDPEAVERAQTWWARLGTAGQTDVLGQIRARADDTGPDGKREKNTYLIAFCESQLSFVRSGRKPSERDVLKLYREAKA